MLKTANTYMDVLEIVAKNYPHVPKNSFKFKQIVASISENSFLSKNGIYNLAMNIGLRFYQKPIGIPETWDLKICKKFLAQKYINPSDSYEYVVVLPPDRIGFCPYVIHRTLNGWGDVRWFSEVLPQLDNILKMKHIPFSLQFNKEVNKEKKYPGQIQALNLFFEKYVPGLEGICASCFQVMLPKSGSGERWLHTDTNKKIYEVRLSAAKPLASYAEQRREYVSQTITEKNEPIYAMWDPQKSQVDYTAVMEQGFTHIPWEIYDFEKFSLGMPLCQCKKNFK
ncbi:MAG: hypothetical protein H0V82_03065 [Candidatus Protochlamydia sp.]|nr:hypothetical protein [Candidatus Protochlamydia sp.]